MSLKQVLQNGIDARIEAHAKTSDLFKDQLAAWGLKLVSLSLQKRLHLKKVPVSRTLAAHTLSAIYYPENIDKEAFMAHISQQGIVVAKGLHRDIATQYFRIGHMGISSVEVERKHVQKVMEVLHAALLACGVRI